MHKSIRLREWNLTKYTHLPLRLNEKTRQLNINILHESEISKIFNILHESEIS